MLLSNREAFTGCVSLVYKVTFMVERATVISNYDALPLPEDKMFLSVDFKANVTLSFVEE